MWKKLGWNDFDNLLENGIVPLHVLPKVSSHTAVVEYMKEAQSLTTQRAGSIAPLLPQLQIGIMWKGVSTALRANFTVLAGRA